jgi:nucleoside phosphorylase
MESEYSNDEYTVAWICALQDEFDVATAMLSHEHGLPQHLPESDSNAYILGEIGEHKIVLACLPAGRTGVHSAAAVVENMRRTFSSLRFGLLVGIGGGVPNLANGVDIRLGDIAVSVPHGSYGGVVQYDYGKSEAGDTFNHCGQLNSPPEKLLSYVSILQSFQRRLKNPRNLVRQFLDELDEYSDEYGYPDIEDRLFRPDCMHTTGPDQVYGCNLCDTTQLVHRKRRRNSDPAIHLGLIASGNTVIRDSTKRDRINREYGNSIICFEMEAAGLMNNFPCLVIRGISDYADSHKNDNWRYRAIATASAYAKSLLTLVRPSEVSAIPEIRKVMATGKC